MGKPEHEVRDESALVFAAYNRHDECCGAPPRPRNTDHPGLYHGDFENGFGEHFVFTFDQTTGERTVCGGDLDWGNPRAFTRGLLAKALRST